MRQRHISTTPSIPSRRHRCKHRPNPYRSQINRILQRAQPDTVNSLCVLTASIAHEINQPLSGIMTNASTCLRMLNADAPNLDGARETARRTIRDVNRALEVINRLRALFAGTAIATEPVDLNEAVVEALALSRSELDASRVTVRYVLADRSAALGRRSRSAGAGYPKSHQKCRRGNDRRPAWAAGAHDHHAEA